MHFDKELDDFEYPDSEIEKALKEYFARKSA